MRKPLIYDTEQEPYMPEYIDLDHIGKILHEEFMELEKIVFQRRERHKWL